jgi:tellurite resistance protein TehA-like permease
VKRRIERFSPHQNAKIFAVLVGAVSVLFVLPLAVYMFFTLPRTEAMPAVAIVALPLGYALFSYISVVVASALYNVLFKYIGGIEFEVGGE